MIFANCCQQGRVLANGPEKKGAPKRLDSPSQVASFKQFIATLTAQTLTPKSRPFKQAAKGSTEARHKDLDQEINNASANDEKKETREQRYRRYIQHRVTLPPQAQDGSGQRRYSMPCAIYSRENLT